MFKPFTDKQQEENKILKEQKQLIELSQKAITEGPEKPSSITSFGHLVQK